MVHKHSVTCLGKTERTALSNNEVVGRHALLEVAGAEVGAVVHGEVVVEVVFSLGL